jgi:hypothetical protein
VALTIHMDPSMMSSSVENEDPDPEIFLPPSLEENHFPISDLGQKQNENMHGFNIWSDSSMPFDEHDDLPDHRIYGIDYNLLKAYADVFGIAETHESPYHDFATYIRCIEPDEVVRAMIGQARIVVDEWYNLHANPLNAFHKRHGMFEFILGSLESNVFLTMNRRIIIKSFDLATDNVYWGVVTCWPSPKPSWIRWQRWRFYFNHLNIQKMVLGFHSEIPNNPPVLRDKDATRMRMTRWCLLNVTSGQFEMLPASKDDSIPASNVLPKEILLYDKCSIWDTRFEINHSLTIWNQTQSMQPFVCTMVGPCVCPHL